MIKRLATAIAMVFLVSNAMADAYVVTSTNGSDDIKLATKYGDQKCVFADKEVQPGDTIALKDTDVVMVCSGSLNGGVFIKAAQGSAQGIPAIVSYSSGK